MEPQSDNFGRQDFEPQSTGQTSNPAARYQVRLTRVTSVILMSQRQSFRYTGAREQLESKAKGVLIHNLLLGWWGVPAGPIWTAMALWRNHKAVSQLRAISERELYSIAA